MVRPGKGGPRRFHSERKSAVIQLDRRRSDGVMGRLGASPRKSHATPPAPQRNKKDAKMRPTEVGARGTAWSPLEVGARGPGLEGSESDAMRKIRLGYSRGREP